MISATFVERLARPLGGLEVQHHAALRIGLAEHFAHVVRDHDGTDHCQLERFRHRLGGKSAPQPNHDCRHLVGRIVYFHLLERLDRVKFDRRTVGHRAGPRPPPGFPDVRLRRHSRRHALETGGLDRHRAPCSGSGMGRSGSWLAAGGALAGGCPASAPAVGTPSVVRLANLGTRPAGSPDVPAELESAAAPLFGPSAVRASPTPTALEGADRRSRDGRCRPRDRTRQAPIRPRPTGQDSL